jgi:hypothetical protein
MWTLEGLLRFRWIAITDNGQPPEADRALGDRYGRPAVNDIADFVPDSL